LKDLVEYIACSLVDDPDRVSITERKAGNRIKLELSVRKEDMGQVIGKGGRVANAMRVLLRVVAAREGKQITLEVVDPN